MPNRTPLVEFLEVGQLATVGRTYDSDEKRYSVNCLGWEEGNFIIFDLPKEKDSPIYIPPKTLLTFRVASKKGVLVSFETVSIDSILSPYQLLVVNFPRRFDIINIRASERISVYIIAKVKINDVEEKGYIVDISEGGVGMEVSFKPKKGDKVFISFKLPNGEPINDMPCEVRSVKEISDKIHRVGLKLLEEDGEMKKKIKEFLNELKSNIALWRK